MCRTPGIVYGGTGQPQLIELDHNALWHALKKEVFHSTVLEMEVAGNESKVLLRDVQMHPFKQLVLHVDFQRVDKSKKIHMKVPLHFINAEICPGVKVGGGVVNHIMNEVNVQCLPDDLPEYIEVNLDKLELGHSLHINEVALPKGVEPIPRVKKDNPAVVTVHVPKVIVVEEDVAAPVTQITGQTEAEAAAAAEGKDGDKKEGGKSDKADKKEPAGDKKEAGKKE